MSRLSPSQRAALVALADAGEHTAQRLAEALTTSPQGAAKTASSLVRRGHVIRLRDRGRVVYKITGAGLAQLQHHQTALA